MNIHFETFGCSANQNDSELMAGLLEQHGHDTSASMAAADVVVVNTCTVKGKTEAHIRSTLQRITRAYPSKKLVVAGCMAEAQAGMVKELVPQAFLIGPHRIHDIAAVVEGRRLEALGYSSRYKLAIPSISKNPHVRIIQINDGCANWCTFCITKLAKPRLISYPVGMLVNEVRQAAESGVKEIWLTSQDTGAYGLDRRTNLAGLLRSVAAIERDITIRVGMMNPQKTLPVLDETADAFAHPRIFQFLHLPLQAGSDDVLKHMRRGYTASQFRGIVAAFRKRMPALTLSTDVICGYPTETASDFEETLQLVREVQPDIVNVSRFSPRPGTAAAKLPRIPDSVLKERSLRLTRLWKRIAEERNGRWNGWEGSILVTEAGRAGTVVGRTFAYKPVVLHGGKALLGKRVPVRITGFTRYSLRGCLLETPVVRE